MIGQSALFDTLPLLGQTTVEEHVTAAEVEQRAENARVAAQAAEEAARAERDAVAIRAMIGATLPAGAADRWAAAFAAPAEEAGADLVAAVREYALAHYAQGWDVVVECRTDAELVGMIGDATTAEEAIEEVAEWVGLMVETQTHTAPGEPVEEVAEEPVDVDALRMSPKVRALVADIDAGPWHYQTRKGALDKGLVTDIKATALTTFGERVRAELLAQ
ncbi:hypothetical protein [Nocardiopsis sp. HUAS JQ3]|uniref:hypothetical protein n=1 Tax=Nocardiopsis sp. HUAS JQ3 TaxID=3061629 RepID=UPI0023A9BF22|nr:hypothetical protein [Nocardiopsis sp. HUAS JQ3]WDZ91151.1 hypothetical protein PV789_00815 [Nocardiopsis sp. HUAS JQ3]